MMEDAIHRVSTGFNGRGNGDAVPKVSFTFLKTYNILVTVSRQPLNPLKGTLKPPLQGRFGGVKSKHTYKL